MIDIIEIDGEKSLQNNMIYIKDIINNKIKNLSNLHKISTKNYCYFCKDEINHEVIIDFKKGKMKEKIRNCNYKPIKTQINNYNFKITDDFAIVKLEKDDIGNCYLNLYYGLFNILLSGYYEIKEYNIYGKKLYSEHEEKVKIIISNEENKLKIVYENHLERVFIDKQFELVIELFREEENK